jgi:predicted MFS family arabinose efflux permease
VPERPTRPFRPAIDGLLLGVRSGTFWLLASTFFICGLSTNGLIGVHLIPAAVDHHMTAVAGASLLALIGVFDIVGTTVSGWLTDRADPRRLLAWYYALRGLSVIALPFAFGSTAALVAFAVFFGLDFVATVPPTVALTADRFGPARVGVVFAWVFAAHQFGAAFAAWSAGVTREWFGSYTFAFVSSGVLCLLAAALSLRIEWRRAPLPVPVPA